LGFACFVATSALQTPSRPATLVAAAASPSTSSAPAFAPATAHSIRAAFLTPHSAVFTPPPTETVGEFWRAVGYLAHDEATISQALDFAVAAHDGQRRKSGEAYVVHPIEVAVILAQLHMDTDTIVAGLLHDTVEDTEVTVEQIRHRFGTGVASIVAGVTDGEAVPEAHNQRELLLAMSRDWRVVLVKLADRLHNMRTLEHMPPTKQVRKSRETAELFVPLARLVGVGEIEHELEWICNGYLRDLPEHELNGDLLETMLQDEGIGELIGSHRARWRTHCGLAM